MSLVIRPFKIISTDFSLPEPKAHKVSLYDSNDPPYVRCRPHVQTWIGQSWSNFIWSIIGVGERLHKDSHDWPKLWQHGNRKRPLTYNGENDVSTFSLLFLIRSFSNLQVTMTGIKSRTSSTLPILGKWCLQASTFIFDPISVKLAVNQDRHKISDEFEFRSDRIGHSGVPCPWAPKILKLTLSNINISKTS